MADFRKNLEKVEKKNPSSKETPFGVVFSAIQRLPNERMQEVVVRRFGLDEKNPRTLEAIGRNFKITRERVRQIENEALKRLNQDKKKTGIANLIGRLKELLESRMGIVSEKRIFREFEEKGSLSDLDNRALLLLLRLGPEFNFFNDPKKYERAWYLKEGKLETIKELDQWLEKRLREEGRVISKQKLINILNENEKLKPIDNDVLYTYVDIPKVVERNIFNKWGLIEWPQIKPRGVRDKIYLAFKKAGKPMHFKEVAKEINSLGVDSKKACTPTVHNELIRDPRFILIGRGIYALSEWKYKKGTVAEVIQDILKQNGKPMKKEDIIKEILRQRQVKLSTVVLNLHNNSLFQKVDNGLYFLR